MQQQQQEERGDKQQATRRGAATSNGAFEFGCVEFELGLVWVGFGFGYGLPHRVLIQLVSFRYY